MEEDSDLALDDPCAAIPAGFFGKLLGYSVEEGRTVAHPSRVLRLGEPEALMRKRLVYSNVYSAGEEAEEYAANKIP